MEFFELDGVSFDFSDDQSLLPRDLDLIIIRMDRFITEGDLLAVDLGLNGIKFIRADKRDNHPLHTPTGVLLPGDFIGARYGDRVMDNKKKSWVTVLRPTPSLWTQALTHRTQILYYPDISVIVGRLGITPGDIVFESGTGSGSLTTAFASAVGGHGHVFTFEFHAGRASAARMDFGRNGIENVTVIHRDIVGNGLPAPGTVLELGGGDEIPGPRDGGPKTPAAIEQAKTAAAQTSILRARIYEADAVFLDLPAPWGVVQSARDALKNGGVLCCFSPCIEQVGRTCETLRASGQWAGIETIEVLLKPLFVLQYPEAVNDNTGLEPLPGRVIDGILNARHRGLAEEAPGAPGAPGPGAEVTPMDESTGDDVEDEGAKSSAPELPTEWHRKSVTRPVVDIAGHTGFLTFAVAAALEERR